MDVGENTIHDLGIRRDSYGWADDTLLLKITGPRRKN
jgi:hypothetical protein